jgi:anaerobic selenocysteine-containing dehydrogenase
LGNALLRKMVAIRVAQRAARLIQRRDLAAAAVSASVAAAAAAASAVAASVAMGSVESEESVVSEPEVVLEPVLCSRCAEDGGILCGEESDRCEQCGGPLVEEAVSENESPPPSPRLSEADASVTIQVRRSDWCVVPLNLP